MRPLCGRFTATLRPLCGHFAVTRRRIRQLARPVSFQKVFVTGRRRRKKKAKKKTAKENKRRKKKEEEEDPGADQKWTSPAGPGSSNSSSRFRSIFRVLLFFCLFVFFFSLSLSLSLLPEGLSRFLSKFSRSLTRPFSFVVVRLFFFVCRFARFLLLDVLLFCYFAQSASGSAGLPGPSPSWPSSRPSYGSWNELWANRNERNVKIDTKPKEKNDEEIVRE